MAAYNKTLGRFHLDGIAPAPRGVPQIEVTFDIDANGIVNVSAKDLATGKQQNITITASTNMSKEDVEAAVKEADRFAAEDKKRREEADARNHADQMVYQCEKTLNELGDKITPEEKSKVQDAIDRLKEALKGTNIDEIKNLTEELTKEFYAVSEKLYKDVGAQQGDAGAPGGYDAGPDSSPAGDGPVYDAEYKVVDEDEEEK